MAAHQAPPSLGFSRQEHWSGLPFSSPMNESEKWKWSRSVVSDSWRPHGLQPTRLLHPWDFPGKSTGVGCHFLLLPDQGLNQLPCIGGPILNHWTTREVPIYLLNHLFVQYGLKHITLYFGYHPILLYILCVRPFPVWPLGASHTSL